MVLYKGSCHCGIIKFEVEAGEELTIIDCNCSICFKKGFQHLIVSKDKLKINSDMELLSLYTFNTHIAKHYFCKKCGICPFYIPRSNPDGFDINYRCIDEPKPKKVVFEPYDGNNWEQQPSLAHLSASS
ncbi:DUF636-domain-containing protein [Neoconidiobolus thromboides FSU 785]|nr:DUF636-domain-containing protein [Neoconidiobolus thromboides FSU 785]